MRAIEPTVPTELADLVGKCLEKEPSARPTARELGERLTAFADELGILSLDALHRAGGVRDGRTLKAVIPGAFPERAFSTEYALKDLGYALDLAADVGLDARGSRLVGEILRETIEAGFGKEYWPVIAKVIDR